MINFSKTDSISLFLLTFCSNVFLLINSKYLNLTNLENDLDLLFRVKIDYIYLILISSIFISTTYIFADWLFKRISDKNILLLYGAIYRTFIYIGSFAIYLTIFRIIGISRMIFLVILLIFFFINLIILSKYTKSSFNLSVSFVLLFLMFAYLNQQNFSNENKNENNDQNNLAEESSIVETKPNKIRSG